MFARFGQMALMLAVSGAISACSPKVPDNPPPPETLVSPEVLAMYAAVEDDGRLIPAVNPKYLIDENVRREVDLRITEPVGTIVIDPWQRYLYYVLPNDRAIRYRVAVGDQGRSFNGTATANHSRKWPNWTPTANMVREFPELYGPYKAGVPGGLENPLGARAIYLYSGGKDTYYRIHGTNEVASIGHATSAGCIRLYNQDILHLEQRFKKGSKVIVLTQEQSQAGFGAYVPNTTPYSGASFRAAGAAAGEDASIYTPEPYANGFPESPGAL